MMVVCKKCNGTGGIDEGFCAECGGSGYDCSHIDTMSNMRVQKIIDMQNTVFDNLRKQSVDLFSSLKKLKNPVQDNAKENTKEPNNPKQEELKKEPVKFSDEVVVVHNPQCCKECHFYDPRESRNTPNEIRNNTLIKYCTFLKRSPIDTVVAVERDANCPFDPKTKKRYVLEKISPVKPENA